MDKYDFEQGIKKLEGEYEKGFTAQRKRIVEHMVFTLYKLNSEEWGRVIDGLLHESEYLPRVRVFKEAITRQVKNRDDKSPLKTDCQYCSSMGWVWCIPHGNYSKKSVIPCGCKNTPSWDRSPTWRQLMTEGKISKYDLQSSNKVPLADLIH